MTYEDRKRLLCQQCGKQQCGYANRGLQDKCPAIQEKMEGWELGYQDATDNPTGGELLHVLEKGRKIGFQDAVDKAYKWLIKRYENQGVILLEDIHELNEKMEE